MLRSWSWIVWGAVVVAGSIASYEIWVRALDPGREAAPGVAPRVSATVESKVPVIVTARRHASKASRRRQPHHVSTAPTLQTPVQTVTGAVVSPVSTVRPSSSKHHAAKSRPAASTEATRIVARTAAQTTTPVETGAEKHLAHEQAKEAKEEAKAARRAAKAAEHAAKKASHDAKHPKKPQPDRPKKQDKSDKQDKPEKHGKS